MVPIPKLAVSNTLRSAVGGYIKTLSEQVAPFGVTCNMVLPGRIDTPRTAIDAGGAAESVDVEEMGTLLGRDPDGPLWNTARVCVNGRFFGERQGQLRDGNTGESRRRLDEVDKRLTTECWKCRRLCGYHGGQSSKGFQARLHIEGWLDASSIHPEGPSK